MKLFLSLILMLNASSLLAKTYWGQKVPVGNGYARSFVEMNGKKPHALGIALSAKGLENLPMEMQEYVLNLPAGAKIFPYKHLTLDWNPHGHEPDHVYDKPHFDFHFYFISNAAREAITCIGADAAVCTKQPLPQSLADHYAPTPAGVPKMGWHWVDLLAPEFNGGIFTRTFIYGYYNGALIFVEPMVTKEYLKSKATSVNSVRQPEQFPYRYGAFPQQYKVSYDTKNHLHKVVLKKF